MSAGPGVSSGAYTPEEALIVNQALRTHRDTTAAAERALKTANRTKEVAAATLEDLERQGDQLGRVRGDLNTIDADVEESRSIVRYMRRCCLFFLCSCCCECDPDANRDAQRAARVKVRKAARATAAAARAEAAKRRAEGRGGGLDGPSLDPPSESAARAELFGRAPSSKKGGKGGGGKAEVDRSGGAYQIGGALAPAEREALAAETDAQEDYLDKIGDALADLKRMGQDLHAEVGRQDGTIDGLAAHAARARDDILHVNRSAVKGFKVKPVSAGGAAGGSGGGAAQAAAARTAGKAAGKAAAAAAKGALRM